MQGMYGGGRMHGMGGMHGGMHGFGGFSRPMNWNALGKMGDIDTKTQSHLLKVYATLCSGILASALGVYIDWKFAVAGLMTQIGLLVSIVGLNFIRDVYNRLAVFHVTGLLIGCNLSPMLVAVAMFRPDIIITALLGTCTIFACFSGAALFAKRRHFLYLGGALSSALSMMAMMRFMNFIMGGALSQGMFFVNLYGGLVVFMGYIIFDTQMIIEDVAANRNDFVGHAQQLFIDFVAIFVRLLQILMRNADKKREDERRRR